jgi:hypothetical protein
MSQRATAPDRDDGAEEIGVAEKLGAEQLVGRIHSPGRIDPHDVALTHQDDAVGEDHRSSWSCVTKMKVVPFRHGCAQLDQHLLANLNERGERPIEQQTAGC